MKLLVDSDRIQYLDIAVGDELSGNRLDSAISQSIEQISRNRAQILIEAGNVTIDGKTISSKKHIVKTGEKIIVHYNEAIPLEVKPEKMDLDIVYEDDSIMVINKPKGMVVHPAPGNLTGTLVNGLLYYCGNQLSGVNGDIRPGIVHRLDKDTSGLLAVAKNDDAHEFLGNQLADHTMKREYEAIVLNNIKEDQGTINMPIGRDPANRLRKKVMADGRRAVTHFQVLERWGEYTYLKLELETGRTHQIRVHMSYTGHPLLGDKLYGSGKNPFGADSQTLHGRILSFVHPKSKELMLFESPLPQYFVEILEKIKKKNELS